MSNDFNNPYRPPSAYVADAETVGEDNFLSEPRAVPAGNATTWLGAGWNMFKEQAGIWVLMALVYGVLYLIVNFIPFVGGLVLPLLVPVMSGGLVYACEQQRTNGSIEFSYLFAGFQQNTGQLMLIGLFNLALGFVIGIIAFIFMMIMIGSAAATGGLAGGSEAQMFAALMGMGGVGFIVFMLIAMVILVLFGGAIWLAPALIMLHNLTAIEAIKLGWQAFKKNLVGALVCGLILTVLAFFGALLFGLGMLIVGPLITTTAYATYRDLFFEDDEY